jgi:hypothetical protein
MLTSSLPRRVVVTRVISGRYQPGTKPDSWDSRSPGIEEIESGESERIILYSDGGQSTPSPGWDILLTGTELMEQGKVGFRWTLYGIPPHANEY